MNITTPTQAKELGLKHYFTGVPCKYGHVEKRRISNGDCLGCRHTRSKEYYINNPEKIAAMGKRWRKSNQEKVKDYYIKNRDVIIARSAKWAAENPDKRLAATIKWQKSNPIKYAAYHRERFQKQKDRISSLNKQWRLTNPDKRRSYMRNRHAKKNGNGGSHTGQDIAEILVMQGGKCAYFGHCGTIITPDNHHVDHIIPIAAGGSNYRHNLQILCQPCNNRKHTKDPLIHCRSLGWLL